MCPVDTRRWSKNSWENGFRSTPFSDTPNTYSYSVYNIYIYTVLSIDFTTFLSIILPSSPTIPSLSHHYPMLCPHGKRKIISSRAQSTVRRSPFLLGVQGIGFLLSWAPEFPQRRLNGSTTNPGKQQDDSSIIERYCDSILIIILNSIYRW